MVHVTSFDATPGSDATTLAIGSKYGMSDMSKQCPEAVTELYDAYLMTLIPMGDEPVQGWEPEVGRYKPNSVDAPVQAQRS